MKSLFVKSIAPDVALIQSGSSTMSPSPQQLFTADSYNVRQEEEKYQQGVCERVQSAENPFEKTNNEHFWEGGRNGVREEDLTATVSSVLMDLCDSDQNIFDPSCLDFSVPLHIKSTLTKGYKWFIN